MKLLEKFRRFKDLKKLRAMTQRQPSPENLALLAESYIAAGRVEDAYLTARRGIARFPASARLATVCRYALKQKMSPVIAQLRDDLGNEAHPETYRHLAEIYMELGDRDRALQLCEECLELFPDFDEANLIIGEIRLRRFFKHRVSMDGLEAERQLRRALRLNHRNSKAVTLLAQLYFTVGARNAMEALFNTVLRNAPGVREVEDLSKAANARRFWDRLPSAGYTIGDLETVADQIRRVEVSGEFAIPPHQFPGGPLNDSATAAATWARLDERALRSDVHECGRHDGVHGVTALGEEARRLASISDDEYLSKEEFEELVTELYTTLEETTRRMDVGGFVWCSIEGNGGGLAVQRVRNVCMGMLFEQPVKAPAAHETLQRIASRNFVAPGGSTDG